MPGGFEMDATGAHTNFCKSRRGYWSRLVRGNAARLVDAQGHKLKLAARAVVNSPKFQGGSGLSLEKIVKFDWEVALVKSGLSLEELEMLAKLKSPLVRIRGQWVELTPKRSRRRSPSGRRKQMVRQGA